MSDFSQYFSRSARLLRRANRMDSFSNLSGSFNRDSTRKLTTQTAGLQCVALIREVLDGYRFPASPKLSYSGVRNARIAADSSVLEDGVVTIYAEFRTHTGVLVGMDIPVEIRKGELQEPSVIVYNGAPRIIAQSTFDDIAAGHTFYEEPEPRSLYSAPFSHETNKAVQQNRIKIERVNTGLFSLQGSRDALRAAVQGKSIKSEWVKPWEQEEQVEEETEQLPEKSASPEDYDADDRHEKPDPDRNDFGENDYLDPAETVEDHDIYTGEERTLSQSLEVKDRGGATYDLPAGTKCLICRDHAGDNKSFVVEFEDGLQAIVDRCFLKNSSKKKDRNVTKLPKPKPLKAPKLKSDPTKPCKKCQTGACPYHRPKSKMAQTIQIIRLRNDEDTDEWIVDFSDGSVGYVDQLTPAMAVARAGIQDKYLTDLKDENDPYTQAVHAVDYDTFPIEPFTDLDRQKFKQEFNRIMSLYTITGLGDDGVSEVHVEGPYRTDLSEDLKTDLIDGQPANQDKESKKAQNQTHFLDKINSEIEDLQNQGLNDIDIRLAVQSKYGSDIVEALFNKTGQVNPNV